MFLLNSFQRTIWLTVRTSLTFIFSFCILFKLQNNISVALHACAEIVRHVHDLVCIDNVLCVCLHTHKHKDTLVQVYFHAHSNKGCTSVCTACTLVIIYPKWKPHSPFNLLTTLDVNSWALLGVCDLIFMRKPICFPIYTCTLPNFLIFKKPCLLYWAAWTD